MKYVLPILLWITIFGINTAAVTLTSNDDLHCLGLASRITCTHPFNDGSLVILWERNGTRLTNYIGGSEDEHSLVDVEPTYTKLDIHVIGDEFNNKVWIYRCYTQNLDTSVREYSNEVVIDAVEVSLPNVTAIQPKSDAIKYNVEHTPNMECYSQHTFQYRALWCPVINGVPDVTQLQNGTFPSSGTVVIDGLKSDMEYEVNITAECVGNEDVDSDSLSLGFTTVGESVTSFSPAGPVCYDRQVQLTCHHHDITDTTSSGPIFNQTSPVVWMKDGERIDLPDTNHMVVSQSNTETVVNMTTRKSVFLNGEANYSCAVVYADGSTEKSEPVTVRVRESPLPPTSLTSIPSDTSIYLMWFHSDECFESCTFMYEVTWQQSGDGSSLRNTTTTETSYTIEDLTPGTSYEIGIGAYCKEDPSVRSEIRNSKTTLSPLAGTVVIGVAVGVSILLIVVFIVLAVVCIMVPRVKPKSKQSFGEAASKVWKNGMKEVTANQLRVVKEKYIEVLVQDDNQPEEEDESASNHPSGLTQEKVECKYAEVDHTRGAKPRNVANDNYGDGKYDEVNCKKPPKEETTSGVGDGGKDTHEIKGKYVTLDHLKGEKPRHQPNPNLGDGQYAEIKTASEEFAFEEAKSEMVNDQTSRLEKPTSDAELRAGGIAFQETILVGTKKIDGKILSTQETRPFESFQPIFPHKRLCNHWFDEFRPITYNKLTITNPIAGDEEEN